MKIVFGNATSCRIPVGQENLEVELNDGDVRKALNNYQYKYATADLFKNNQKIASFYFDYNYGKWHISNVETNDFFF